MSGWHGRSTLCLRILVRAPDASVDNNRAMDTEDAPPEGYIEPSAAWCVEYVDPRQPGEGSFQVGAFTTEAEAAKLMSRLENESFFAELRINLVSVHHRVEDWEWDR